MTYHAFPDSNAVWCGYRNFINYNPPDSSEIRVYTYQQEIGNDTVINGNIYHKLIESGEFSWQAWPMPYYTGSLFYFYEYIGCFRESNKIIYFIQPNDINEYTLYDFNLNVGDTIQFSVNSGGDIMISSIDSILINSTYRKRFNISDIDTSLWWDPNHFEYVSIIEGIGSSHGLIWTIGPYNPEVGGMLEAFKLNGIVIFPDTSTVCNVTSINEIGNFHEEISVYPNPFVTFATIRIDSFKHFYRYAILDILGRVIDEDVITNENTIVYKNNLLPGMYLLNLFENNGTIISKRLFVQ